MPTTSRICWQIQQRWGASSSISSNLLQLALRRQLHTRAQLRQRLPNYEAAAVPTAAAAASENTAQSPTTLYRHRPYYSQQQEYRGYGHENYNQNIFNVNAIAAAGVAVSAALAMVEIDSATTTATTTTNCEANQQQNYDDRDEDDDPYANLPEEDEETSCTMCKKYRKGPCRPVWRKFEACMKDHENDDDGEALRKHCSRYAFPHNECLKQYTNLYLLVQMEQFQDIVEITGDACSDPKERRTWQPDVDWTNWKQFHTIIENDNNDEKGGAGISKAAFQQTLPSGSYDPKVTPYWKRLPPDTEPDLVYLSSTIPKTDSKSKMIVKRVYAVDQDGQVLGLAHNKAYWALEEQAKNKKNKGKEKSDKKKNAGSSRNDEGHPEDDPNFVLDFFVLPGETKSVKVCALYSENPLTAKAGKEWLDVLLFESPLYGVDEALQQEEKKSSSFLSKLF